MLDSEKNKIVSSGRNDDTFSEAKDETPVRQMPIEALVYSATQIFHCLPSEVLDEDYNLLTNVLTIHNTYAEIDEATEKLKGTTGKIKLDDKIIRRMAIALELEKLK